MFSFDPALPHFFSTMFKSMSCNAEGDGNMLYWATLGDKGKEIMELRRCSWSTIPFFPPPCVAAEVSFPRSLALCKRFASLQDQPERRKSNYIMLGGSKFTARWGYSLDINQLRQYIPPCSECELALGQNAKHSNMIAACGSCVC
jgi:hypothetical protein